MDSRTDFQRLLEDMDKVIQSKRQELVELDERLEIARRELSEKEAKELIGADVAKGDSNDRNLAINIDSGNNDKEQISEHIRRQTKLYEQQVEQFGAELSELENMNQELFKENELLRRELLKCQSQCDRLSESVQKLETNLCDVQATKLELELRFSKAEAELQMQEKLLLKSHQEDEVLMDALNDKLESMRKAIEWRDEEIKQLRMDNQFVMDALRVAAEATNTATGLGDKEGDDNEFDDDNFGEQQQLNSATSPTGSKVLAHSRLEDKSDHMMVCSKKLGPAKGQPVLEILSAFREKDSQIELLKSQLLQATKDLERNANLLENHSYSKSKDHIAGQQLAENPLSTPSMASNQFATARRDINLSANGNNDNQLELVSKIGMLENELEAKDRQLHGLEFRLHHYEAILPNMISDLVQELLLAHRSAKYNKFTATTNTGGGNNNSHDNRTADTNDNGGQTSFLEPTNEPRLEPTAASQPERKLEVVIETLKGLLNKIDSARGLLDLVERLKALVEAREAHIRQLVMDLNQMDAKFGLVQQQCDLLRQQTSGQSRDADAATGVALAEAGASLGSSQPEGQPKLVRFRERPTDQLMSVDDELAAEGVKGNTEGAAGCQVDAAPLDNKKRDSQSPSEQSIKLSGLPLQSGDFSPSKAAVGGQDSIPAATRDSSIAMNSGNNNNSTLQSNSCKPEPESQAGGRNSVDGLRVQGNRSIRRLVNSVDENGSSTSESGELAKKESMAEFASQHKDNHNSNNNNIGRALKLQTRLRQLKSENELLELAMKEILLALKWTDGQCSSLLIDCPSLERLCQLIEARFLVESSGIRRAPAETPGDINMNNSNPPDGCCPTVDGGEDNQLFQYVVLKSELDLLRGQNEQLRVDVKIQRHQYHELLRQQTNELQNQLIGKNPRFEASCQTDSTTTSDGDMSCPMDQDPSPTNRMLADQKCQNCSKLAKLTGHLSQCIVRIETRVSVCDETYINRMVNLHQLIQALERDLATREELLNGSRRECHLLAQQRLMLEARLQFVENKLSNHLSACPMSHLQPGSDAYTNQHGSAPNGGSEKLQVYTTARNGNGDSIQSLTIKQSERVSCRRPTAEPRVMKNARMTISLLQSIIGCLQARLDFKDERLRQLEALISQQSC